MKFNSLLQVSEYFSDTQKCVEYIKQVRWSSGVQCCFCGCKKVYELKGKNKRFKCSFCKKQFSVIKGTIFENSPLPLQKWFVAIYLLISRKKGISSVQLSKDIGVTIKTAWFMLHRIRYMLKERTLKEKLKDYVQIDETFIGGKNKNRHWDKKVKNSQGRSFKDKTPVLGLLEQELSYTIERPHKVIPSRTVFEKVIVKPGRLVTKVVRNTQAGTLKPIIYQMVERGTTLITDEWKAYNGLDGIYDHHIVNHLKKQYVSESGLSSNGVENAWSILKRSIIGAYHNVTRKHLHRYTAEFTFRYNNRSLNAEDLLKKSMTNLGRRLSWNQLTHKAA